MDAASIENPAVRLIGRFGDKAGVAEHFGISREAVRLWLKNGIPPDRALEAEEVTEGTRFEVSAKEILQFARQQKAAALEMAEQGKRAVA